jgi:hypothetical protein
MGEHPRSVQRVLDTLSEERPVSLEGPKRISKESFVNSKKCPKRL